MKIYNEIKDPKPQIIPQDKKFKHVKPGQIFYYSGFFRIKTDEQTYFKVCLSSEPPVETINSFKIGKLRDDDRFLGSSFVFKPDTIVSVYPHAAIYLGG